MKEDVLNKAVKENLNGSVVGDENLSYGSGRDKQPLLNDNNTEILIDVAGDQRETKATQGNGGRTKQSQFQLNDLNSKKQMEFKGGKLQQIISDLSLNKNKIQVHRYSGIQGVFLFLVDVLWNFEHILPTIVLIINLNLQNLSDIGIEFPITVLVVSIILHTLKHQLFEARLRQISQKINSISVDTLIFTRKFKRFIPSTWGELEAGNIIRVKKGEQFPADCLILDIQGIEGQRCHVSQGPLDPPFQYVKKNSFTGTSNKTGGKMTESQMADLLSGMLKYEYNYHGYIQGQFKLNENPAASEFDHQNVVQRGAYLVHSQQVICLVLNVGFQCMSSVFSEQMGNRDGFRRLKEENFFQSSQMRKTRSFDKYYRSTLQKLLAVSFFNILIISAIIVFISKTDKFQKTTMMTYLEQNRVGQIYFLTDTLSIFLILVCNVGFNMILLIDMLFMLGTFFIENDINIAPSFVKFWNPLASAALGKISHMFMSRSAIQRDDKVCVRVVSFGDSTFVNKNRLQRNYTQPQNARENQMQEDINQLDDSQVEEVGSNYLPNELKFQTQFHNEDFKQLLQQKGTVKNQQLTELLKSILLCSQVNMDSYSISDETMNFFSVNPDEVSLLEFAAMHDFKISQKNKRMMTIQAQEVQERFEELGVIESQFGSHSVIVSVKLKQGDQRGVLYIKGTLKAFKEQNLMMGKDFQKQIQQESKFIKAGLEPIVYGKRDLNVEETNQLIITINENAQSERDNIKLDAMLQSLIYKQDMLMLGLVAIQRAIHLRNRVTIDDMVFNGVKVWIVSGEEEQTHLTALNSLKVFHNCNSLIEINGNSESIVTEQIHGALKLITERMQMGMGQEVNVREDQSDRTVATKISKNTSKKNSKSGKEKQSDFNTSGIGIGETPPVKYHSVVHFTGQAIQVIMKDKTMQKSFLTLAQISDCMVGSMISPVQKMNLIRIQREYSAEDDFTSAIIACPQDQFMANEAELVINLQTNLKSVDIDVQSDLYINDFSALSYLLFKHGSLILLKLTRIFTTFTYQNTLTYIILVCYCVISGFSGSLPFRPFYFVTSLVILQPLQCLIFSVFYKNYGSECQYRIFGHYKYNFTFTVFQPSSIFYEIIAATLDWILVFMPFQVFKFGFMVSVDGKEVSIDAFKAYLVIIVQVAYFGYVRRANVQVVYSTNLNLLLGILASILIFDDDNLLGIRQLITCPLLMLTFFFQFWLLIIRNQIMRVVQRFFLKNHFSLNKWYADVEDRLSYEQYEDPNQTFYIESFQQLNNQIRQSVVQRTLRIINTNMMNCPKSEGLETILEKINIVLDNDIKGSATLSGAINKWTLKLNDINKDAEYLASLNQREAGTVKSHFLTLVLTTFVLATYTSIEQSISQQDIGSGTKYYFSCSVLTLISFYGINPFVQYLNKFTLVFSMVFLILQTLLLNDSSMVHPSNLAYTLLFITLINYNHYYITSLLLTGFVIASVFLSVVNGSDLSARDQSLIIYINIFKGIIGAILINYTYEIELEKKTQFVNGHRLVRGFLKLKSILSILIPSLVRDKMRQGKKNFSEQEGEVSIVFIDINKFDDIVNKYLGSELIELLDKIYNVFDQVCDQYGLQKIETVGKTYMACGGLKQAEKKVDPRLLNRHHTVRVTDYAMEILALAQKFYLKNGKSLEVKIGIHTGKVISGVVGDTKPQFSLIGDTVNKTSRVCSKSESCVVTVSKETHHYLELYTNNYWFKESIVFMKGIGDEPIYQVHNGRSMQKGKTVKHNAKYRSQMLQQVKDENKLDSKENNQQNAEMDLNNSVAAASQTGADTPRPLIAKNEQQMFSQQEDIFDNESNESDQVDEDNINIYGFNDDLNLDDRQIIKNLTENQLYNLVERPKNLFNFKLRDQEDEFFFTVFRRERRVTLRNLVFLIILNKLTTAIEVTYQGYSNTYIMIYLLIPIVIFELILVYKIIYPKLEKVQFWSWLLGLYCIISMVYIISFINSFEDYNMEINNSSSVINQLELAFILLFMSRILFFRWFVFITPLFLIAFVIRFGISHSFDFSNQRMFFKVCITHAFLGLQLSVSVYQREMKLRKTTNYERILTIESEKTNDLIGKLVPYHQVQIIKSEKKIVDEFEDVTLLFTDMVGFTDFSRSVSDPREVVQMLQKLFSRFDQLCEEQKVYKVHTIGDCYVIMGYNGRVSLSKRFKGIAIDEANRVIQCGLQMINIIKEVRESSEDGSLKNLDMRIGIHSGRFCAGIIGSKVVRYDIIGEGVLIANKMESNGIPGRVCISEDTHNLLQQEPNLYNKYTFEKHQSVELQSIGRCIKSFLVTEVEVPDLSESYMSEGDNSEVNSFQNSDEGGDSLNQK